ncbi:hypothetical protein ACFX5U_22530 [Sphingobacterium sp. SG20118]|uniref:hypothetical protein n=1 Tax=Sphingobacterium sp. SG20118 TaxID=3367156 RepID=UPI0037DFC4CA
MDELDQLKKQWQKDQNFIRIDQPEIKTMLHKSSSSIVKWIFIISLIELSLGIILSFIVPTSDKEELFFLQFLDYASQLIFYIGIGYFIYHFFKSYASISNTNSTKILLNSILLSRKHVENYIKFNIYFLIFEFFMSFIQLLIDKLDLNNQWGYNFFMTIVFAVLFTLITLIFISIFKFYYKIVYRRLLKKLNKNYEELSKLEEEKI